MSRTVPEWIAHHDDQAIPRQVKARVLLRCGGRCALTGVKLGPGNPAEFDHILPLIQGGEHRETNLQAICGTAHKAKSAAEAPVTAKVKRLYGWRTRGYDIEAHEYDGERYPGELVLRDILDMHGSEIADADLIVSSSPCTEYSYAEWFDQNLCSLPSASPRRKAASARIAKIPEPLSRHIGRVFRPQEIAA